jgi:3-methyladenine DNA glycosylase AlkD
VRRASRRRAAPIETGPLPLARELITCKSWWDTVDTLATNVIGPLVRRFPELAGEMDRWIEDANMWLRRSAILRQLKYGADTDGSRLFDYVERTMADQDFFIRKAIGRALRQFAKTDPDRVRACVSANQRSLSPLSVREATKYLR